MGPGDDMHVPHILLASLCICFKELYKREDVLHQSYYVRMPVFGGSEGRSGPTGLLESRGS